MRERAGKHLVGFARVGEAQHDADIGLEHAVVNELRDAFELRPRYLNDEERGAHAVLCGELSLLAAQTNPGELIKSHVKLERKKTSEGQQRG